MALRLAFGLVLLASFFSPSFAGKTVVDLTDENFDARTLKGVWMVKVYAPWCAHCRQLEPLWQAFADEVEADGVTVAKINGETERQLMTRFRVKAVPTIFLLRDGYTYEYKGDRNVDAFTAFVKGGYKSADPRSITQAPNSIVGRFFGLLYSVPRMCRSVYRLLHDKYGLSETVIILSVLSIPVTIGGLLICFLDAIYVQRAKDEFGPEHEHQE